MAVIYQPMIRNLTLTVDKDVANAEITVDFDVDWSNFDILTNLSYNEKWELVGVDPASTTVIYTGPMLLGGIRSNGATTTHRTKTATIPWTDLDEDPAGLDELAARVTLTPQLPEVQVAQSAQVVVTAP